MKIITVDTSGRGGICHYTYLLCCALSSLEKEITLLTTRNYELNSFKKNFNIIKILPTHYQKRYKFSKGLIYFRSLIKILFYILSKKPDVVHFHQIKIPSVEFLFYKLIGLNNVKIVITLHDIIPFESKIVSPFLNYICNTADGIIVHSEENLEVLKNYVSEKVQKKIKIIHHGEYSFYIKNITKEDARKILEIDNGKKVLLFFGYIRRYKGLDILLESVKILKEKYPEIFLIIAGEDIEGFSRYQKVINELGIEECVMKRIEYIPIDECSIYFSASDVVVLPYRNIYQSGIVFLSYAHSRPVITTNVGGFPDVVEDGRSGYIVKSNHPTTLAEKIEKLFSSPSEFAKMGDYGYRMAKQKFSWESAAERTYGLYSSICNYLKIAI